MHLIPSMDSGILNSQYEKLKLIKVADNEVYNSAISNLDDLEKELSGRSSTGMAEIVVTEDAFFF